MRTLTAIMLAFALAGGAVQAANYHHVDTACVELLDASRLTSDTPSTTSPVRHAIPLEATMPDGPQSFEVRPRLS